ncbi:TraR/DksA family transcriptional regulator [Endomicrobium proavitum]|uniref:DNA-binding transcriptional regulator of rRNA transcription, DnaK suppressor protein n=1 Tax=Endomicrobium proavitum TaxID=1408281 RepID=A0A0G3WGI4_9BACT|nr:TraR/DksA family transcriptional regulator [Endomicrobium proavitum]AKL97791.1 DNA-binding transcriptional regulator of rRNA transcription, DnaK suppressor protein [Endomicrobium proavitum]
MNKKDAANFKKILIQKRTELLNKVNNAQKELDSSSEENVGDEIDTASQNSQKEMYFELAANDKITLDTINDAIAKVERGTFGKCECCGENITLERLKAIPWSRYCIKCQEEAERPRK